MTQSLRETVAADDSDLDFTSSEPQTEEESINDILSLFSGTKVDINASDTQSMVLSEFGFTDDMLINNSVVLILFVIAFQLIAYFVFVSKMKKNFN